MLFQLNPSSSMIINRARLTSAVGETRDRVNDTNARRSSLVRLKTDCMLHIVLLKSMLYNTSMLSQKFLGRVVARFRHSRGSGKVDSHLKCNRSWQKTS